MKIWIDLINPSDVWFFSGLTQVLDGNVEYLITSRCHAETNDLAQKVFEGTVSVGTNPVAGAGRYTEFFTRPIRLQQIVHGANVGFGFGNIQLILAAKALRFPSIIFVDNDMASQRNGLLVSSVYRELEFLADAFVCPECLKVPRRPFGVPPWAEVFRFSGTKEEIYLAHFQPEDSVLDELPFKSFVVVRPEALFAPYVGSAQSIVPQLLRELAEAQHNIVFLPRIPSDRQLAKGVNVFIPERALNGPNLCWFSEAVMTGSGTLAREAAVLGVPSVSFFPHELLSVDRKLESSGRLLHSRRVDRIIQYLDEMRDKPRSFQRENCAKVAAEVGSILESFLHRIGSVQ